MNVSAGVKFTYVPVLFVLSNFIDKSNDLTLVSPKIGTALATLIEDPLPPTKEIIGV